MEEFRILMTNSLSPNANSRKTGRDNFYLFISRRDD